MINNNLLISVIISLNILFIFIGYILGRMNSLNIGPVSQIKDDSNATEQSFFKKQKHHDRTKNASTIDIDERKVVVAIKTDGLEKKYDSLGDIKQSSENISSSIDKLKNMKGL